MLVRIATRYQLLSIPETRSCMITVTVRAFSCLGQLPVVRYVFKVNASMLAMILNMDVMAFQPYANLPLRYPTSR